MSEFCELKDVAGVWVCQSTRCGRTIKKTAERPPLARCKGSETRGLGDTIAKLTSAIGIKPCGGCKKRQEALNAIFPYKDES